MSQLPKGAWRERGARRGVGSDGAVFVVVFDRPVAAVATECSPHQLGASKAVGRAQHAGLEAGRSVREGRGVCAGVVRYVWRAVRLRLRRRRVGQRAHRAQHVAQQRVELVRRTGGGAAPR